VERRVRKWGGGTGTQTLAVRGVSATVGGNRMGEAALCAAYAIATVPARHLPRQHAPSPKQRCLLVKGLIHATQDMMDTSRFCLAICLDAHLCKQRTHIHTVVHQNLRPAVVSTSGALHAFTYDPACTTHGRAAEDRCRGWKEAATDANDECLHSRWRKKRGPGKWT